MSGKEVIAAMIATRGLRPFLDEVCRTINSMSEIKMRKEDEEPLEDDEVNAIVSNLEAYLF